MNLAQLKAWTAKNKTAALGTAGAGVAGLALYARHKKAAAGAGDPTTGTAAEANTAGLSGYPNTLATDIENQVQDMLNGWQAPPGATGPAGPAGPPGPAKPKTGSGSYLFRYKSALSHLASARKKYRAHPTKAGHNAILKWLTEARKEKKLYDAAYKTEHPFTRPTSPTPTPGPITSGTAAGGATIATPAPVATRPPAVIARRTPIPPPNLRMTS